MIDTPLVATRCPDCGCSEHIRASDLAWKKEPGEMWASQVTCPNCNHTSTVYAAEYVAKTRHPHDDLTGEQHRKLVDEELRKLRSESTLARFGGL
jgi:hypothetical protein